MQAIQTLKRLALLLILTAAVAGTGWGQQTQPSDALAPDCIGFFAFTAVSTGTSGTTVNFDNRQVGCTTWTISYQSVGFTAISLEFQSAPALTDTTPDVFVTFAGTVNTGINPNTATTLAQSTFTGFYPWVRAKLLSKTGTGTVRGTFYGFRVQPTATGTGTVTNVATGCGLAGGPIVAAGTISRAEAVNAQVAAVYAFVTGDCGKLVTTSDGAAVAASIPQAGGAGFLTGWFTDVENVGVGALTITPAVSTINGAATLVLTTGQSARIVSNGTNYLALVGAGSAGICPAGVGTEVQYRNGANCGAMAGTVWANAARELQFQDASTNPIVLIGADPNGNNGNGYVLNTNFNLIAAPTVAGATGNPGSTIDLETILGGDTSIITTGTGGAGGSFRVVGQAGGTAPSAAVASTGGGGGDVVIKAGDGGAANQAANVGNNVGGGAGGVVIQGGTGGAAANGATNTAGAGGDIELLPGSGLTGGGVRILLGTGVPDGTLRVQRGFTGNANTQTWENNNGTEVRAFVTPFGAYHNTDIDASLSATDAQIVLDEIVGSDGATQNFRAARTSLSSPADVISGDTIATTSYYGYNAGGYKLGAQVLALVDGTPTAGAPMRIGLIGYDDSGSQTSVTSRGGNGNIDILSLNNGAGYFVRSDVSIEFNTAPSVPGADNTLTPTHAQTVIATQASVQTLVDRISTMHITGGQPSTSFTMGRDPVRDFYQGVALTTDATISDLLSVAASAGMTHEVVAYVQAHRTGGAAGTAEDGASYMIACTFQVSGAPVATQIGTTTQIWAHESQPSWDAFCIPNGPNITIQVQGAIDNNITWSATAEVMRISDTN